MNTATGLHGCEPDEPKLGGSLKLRQALYGNTFVGLAVSDSLPMPRPTGVFAAMLNITSGVLSVNERPFHSANPNAAGVPTWYGRILGKKRCASVSGRRRSAFRATKSWIIPL